MNPRPRPLAASPLRPLRRVAAGATGLGAVLVTGVLLAGPAGASPSEGWEADPPQSVAHVVLVLAGVPLLLFVVILALMYVPAMARGERVKPGTAPVADQWLGGPRRAAGELAAPDNDTSQAGGAGARW